MKYILGMIFSLSLLTGQEFPAILSGRPGNSSYSFSGTAIGGYTTSSVTDTLYLENVYLDRINSISFRPKESNFGDFGIQLKIVISSGVNATIHQFSLNDHTLEKQIVVDRIVEFPTYIKRVPGLLSSFIAEDYFYRISFDQAYVHIPGQNLLITIEYSTDLINTELPIFDAHFQWLNNNYTSGNTSKQFWCMYDNVERITDLVYQYDYPNNRFLQVIPPGYSRTQVLDFIYIGFWSQNPTTLSFIDPRIGRIAECNFLVDPIVSSIPIYRYSSVGFSSPIVHSIPFNPIFMGEAIYSQFISFSIPQNQLIYVSPVYSSSIPIVYNVLNYTTNMYRPSLGLTLGQYISFPVILLE